MPQRIVYLFEIVEIDEYQSALRSFRELFFDAVDEIGTGIDARQIIPRVIAVEILAFDLIDRAIDNALLVRMTVSGEAIGILPVAGREAHRPAVVFPAKELDERLAVEIRLHLPRHGRRKVFPHKLFERHALRLRILFAIDDLQRVGIRAEKDI